MERLWWCTAGGVAWWFLRWWAVDCWREVRHPARLPRVPRAGFPDAQRPEPRGYVEARPLGGGRERAFLLGGDADADGVLFAEGFRLAFQHGPNVATPYLHRQGLTP